MGARAWDRAHEAAAHAGVELRPLTSVEDASAILRVMVVTWGEQIPRETIRALAGSGNVPWGVFDSEELVGYVLGWAAVEPVDGLHEHSHMLAALPGRRDGGLGYALKLAQRASCLDRGIDLVRWTFDPLVARNAHLNINKLGATCDRFHRDYYGEMPDVINAGDRSDRLVVRWHLGGEPGPATMPTNAKILVGSDGPADAPTPIVTGGAPDAEVIAVQIPRDHAALRAADGGLASAWREAVGTVFDACVGGGYEVVAFDPDRHHGRPTYFLVRGRPV